MEPAAYKGSSTNTTKQSSSGTFNFTPDDTKSPTIQSNIDAARTNAFYGKLDYCLSYSFLGTYLRCVVANSIHVSFGH